MAIRDSRPSARANVLANFLGRGWTGLLAVMFVPIYVRMIGIEAQGIIGLFASLQVVLSILDLGLSATLNRELARASAGGKLREARDLVRTLEILYWGIAFLLAALLVLVGPAFANEWLNAESLSPSVIGTAAVLLGLQIAVQFPQSLYNGGLMGLEKQVSLNVITSVIHLLRFVGVFLPLWLIGPHLITFVSWQVFILFTGTLYIRWSLWRSLPAAEERPTFRLAQLRRTARFTLGVSATGLVTLPLTMTDKFLLSHTLSLESFGYYMLAFQGATALSVIVGPFYKAYLPRFSNLAASGNGDGELRRVYGASCQNLAVVLIPAAATAIFFAGPLVQLWLHSHDQEAIAIVAPLLAIMVGGNLFNGLMNLPYALTLAKGWTSFGFFQNLIASAVYLPLLYVLTNKWGAEGAAASWCLITFGYVTLSAPVLHRKMMSGFYFQWLKFGVVFPALIGAAVLGGVSILLPDSLSPLAKLPWIVLAATAALCCLIVLLPGLRAFRRGIAARVRLLFA